MFLEIINLVKYSQTEYSILPALRNGQILSDMSLTTLIKRMHEQKLKETGLGYIVPLSRQALELIEGLRPLTGNKQYVFYNHSTAKPMSSNALLCVIRTMGYNGKMSGHGFRELASTTLYKQEYMHDAIEIQLAHRVGNAVSQAYNHAQYLEYRTKMMQDWADFIDSLREKITQFPKHKII